MSATVATPCTDPVLGYGHDGSRIGAHVPCCDARARDLGRTSVAARIAEIRASNAETGEVTSIDLAALARSMGEATVPAMASVPSGQPAAGTPVHGARGQRYADVLVDDTRLGPAMAQDLTNLRARVSADLQFAVQPRVRVVELLDGGEPELTGWLDSGDHGEDPTVFLVLGTDDPRHVLAHEMRHLWHRTTAMDAYMKPDQREQDAEQYARRIVAAMRSRWTAA